MGFALIAASGLLAGCTSTAPTPAASAPSAPPGVLSSYRPEAARHEGGRIVLGDWESPTNFSPLTNGEGPAQRINALLYVGLTRLDPKLGWLPDAAVSVPTLENGGVRWDRRGATMDVAYRLRPGLRWSDGQPLTAADVAFTWRVIVDPRMSGVLSTAGYDVIAAVNLKDDLNFSLHFTRIYPEYLALFPAILPEHRLSGIPIENLAQDSFWGRPDVVAGPFRIAEMVADDHVTLVRNEAWSEGRSGRRAHLDSIVYKVYPDSERLLAAARSGQLDLAVQIPDDDLAGLNDLGSMSAVSLPEPAYEQVTFNQLDPNPLTGAPPPWQGDPALLQALRMAVDRPGMVSALLAGRARLADSPVPSLMDRFHLADGAPQYDLERARLLLDQDGWQVGVDGIRSKGGRRLAFSLITTYGNTLRLQVQGRLITDWRKLGAEVSARVARPAQLFSGYAQGGLLERGLFEAGLWTWVIGPDPDGLYPIEHSSEVPSAVNLGSNFGRIESPEIDRSLDAGRASLDHAERSSAYRDLQAAYAKLSAELPLYERTLTVLIGPRLHNLLPNPAPDTTLWNAADWWIDA